MRLLDQEAAPRRCDTVICAADARFTAGFGKIGPVADFGLLHTLPRRIGEGRARQLLFYNEPIGAARAEAIGLVDQIVPPGTALAAALARAARFADAAPLPVAMTKAFLAHGLADALEWERNAQSTLFLTADHAERKAAFLAKRPPKFLGV
jgi:2-(1,2-epoxy-1,2-dihydrophenyl)acetyl-CoA isomerase